MLGVRVCDEPRGSPPVLAEVIYIYTHIYIYIGYI